MSENWRVVREWSGVGEPGNLYNFRLEDIYRPTRFGPPNFHPFIKHEPGPLQVRGDTPEELRERLKAMLAALDEPVLEYTPRKLVELGKSSK